MKPGEHLRISLLGAAACAFWVAPALSAPTSSPGAGALGTASAPPSASEQTASECIERIPGGKSRPSLHESLPNRATSGHTLTLEVTVEHGKGETVLPSGFRFGLSEQSARVLEQHGFFLPDPEGGAAPTLQSTPAGPNIRTRVTVPFVPLPAKPGRQILTLPPLPITVSRASGEIVTLCTQPHPITVEDPIANTPDPKPRGNPPGRRETEVWTAAEQAALVALATLVAAALATALVLWWRRRPKPAPAPVPPRPPWEVALEELFDIKHANFIREQRFAEYFDRVSDTVRMYLGARYGFDGLECTTRETLNSLRSMQLAVPLLTEIETFLRHADLVKFARLTPSEAECELALERGEHIVRQTMPSALASPSGAPEQAAVPRPAAVDSSFAPPPGGAA